MGCGCEKEEKCFSDAQAISSFALGLNAVRNLDLGKSGGSIPIFH